MAGQENGITALNMHDIGSGRGTDCGKFYAKGFEFFVTGQGGLQNKRAAAPQRGRKEQDFTS
jgi:hypothetical protein